MTPEEVNEILERLRDLTFRAMDGEVPYSVDDLLQARRQIQNWNKAGRPGDIPWREQVTAWGLLDAGAEVTPPVETASAASLPTVTAPAREPFSAPPTSPPGLTQEPQAVPGGSPADPDDALQSEFDRGVELLAGGDYKTARTIFETLAGHARGRLVVAVENRRLEAQEKWAADTDRLAGEARRYMERNATDANGIAERWNRVLAQDDRHPDALAALERLRRRKTRDATRKEIEVVRSQARRAADADNLPNLNKAFGDAEALRDNNIHDDLTEPLSQLVADITAQRSLLRGKLGIASTLLASNTVQAYRIARELFNAGTPVIIDDAGAEIETLVFYRKARAAALSYLRQLATQRMDEAGGQQVENPLAARKTLQNAIEFLTDPVLTSEDQQELKATLDKVNERLAEVEERIRKYTDAQQKVAAAAESGLSPVDKLRLYGEAKAIYPTFPDIDTYIEAALDAVSAVVAAELERQIGLARQHAARDDYQPALNTLGQARLQARGTVPHPKPGSDLTARLEEVRHVEEEIIQAQTRYENLMAFLRDVNGLLDAHEQDKSGGRLSLARLQLDQLGEREYEKNHRETVKVRTRLAGLQTIGENWTQGQNAYRRNDWPQAILLLEKVAGSESPERATATTQVRRAEAAQRVLEARELTRQHRAREALTKYRDAENDFRQAGVDEFTERLLQDAQADLNYLKSFEPNDAKVLEAINRANALLSQAQAQTNQRLEILSLRVEPVENFEKALQALDSVRSLETTLTEEMENARRRVLENWRKVYLETMKAVQTSDDLSILDKAIALGGTLQERNLLYAAEDKNTWRSLQEHRLGLRFARLRQRIPPTLDELREMEANRLEYLNLAVTPTDDLRQAYNDAVAQRILHQISQQDKLDDAFSLLQHELRTNPGLYRNESLFAELIHLCWRRRDWSTVRTQAEQLTYRRHVADAKARSNIWLKLNEAAQHLAGGDIKLYEGAFQSLQQDTANPELNEIIVREQTWLVDERVRQLRAEANELLRTAEDDRFIKAVQCYAMANQLDPGDVEVQQGLKRISGELGPSLRTFSQMALDLRLRNNNLADTLAIGRPLQTSLTAIQQVKGILNLDRDTDTKLEGGLKALKSKLDTWSQMDQQLNDIEVSKRRALTTPGPLPNEEGRGWSLVDPVKALRDVQTRASQTEIDPDLQKLLKEQKDRLEALDSRASGLNIEVGAFGKALQDEEFGQVIDKVPRLATLWREAESAGFAGLDELIRYDYPHAQTNVRRLHDHQQMAQRQKSNLEEWQAWAERARKAYESAKKSASILKRDLQALKEEGRSLKEIEKLGQAILDAAAEFEDALDSHPIVDPLSRKAADARASISEAWRAEVLDERGGYQAKANNLLKRVEEELRLLEQGPLRQLRNAMKQLDDARERIGKRQGLFGAKVEGIHRNLFTNAERCLGDCIKIDSRHEDTLRFQRQLRELQDKYLQER